MSIPSIFDWLLYFDFLRGYPAAWVVLGTGILVVLFLDWRISLLALIVQYLIASLLYFDLLDPQLAMVKLFTGMFVCLILYWTARQLTYGQSNVHFGTLWRKAPDLTLDEGSSLPANNLVQRVIAVVIALLVVAVAVWGFSVYLPGLPDSLGYLNLSILLLMALGTTGLIASRHPLPGGMSVLTFLTGFQLYFAALDQTSQTLAILSALEFVVALITSYLTQRYQQSNTTAQSND